MNILLFGKNGQLGWELQRALAPLGQVTTLATHSTDYCGDFTNTEGVVETIRTLRPQIIVNASAYTAVDKAENEMALAELVNTTTVSAIAREAKSLNAWLVHYSTDYVFPGTGKLPWRENDITAPLNTYGMTKLRGETAIQQQCEKYLIFRTSWVFATRGNNFAKTMLRLARERTELSIINDQYGAPTGADLLADSSAQALAIALRRPEVAGLYHLVASGCTTWYDYASFVFDHARQAGVELALSAAHAVPTSSYPTPAQRPLNSQLDTQKFREAFGLTLPDWQHGVKRMLDELIDLATI